MIRANETRGNNEKLQKDKTLSYNYKKYKSKLLRYPTDKEAWLAFLDKFNILVNKL